MMSEDDIVSLKRMHMVKEREKEEVSELDEYIYIYMCSCVHRKEKKVLCKRSVQK